MAQVGFVNFTYNDYDGEPSAVRVRIPALTAANMAATETLIEGLKDAITAVTLGKLVKVVYGNEEVVDAGTAGIATAQRENKWLVQYHSDATFRRYTCEIPCPDVVELDPNDRKNAHIGDAGDVDAFVAAFEALVKAIDGGAAVVDEITFVGRTGV